MDANRSMSTYPPLPSLPSPPIFDPPYNAELMAVLDGSAFPPDMPPDQVYRAQLAIIHSILDQLKSTSFNLTLALLAAWIVMVLMCAVLLIRIRRNRHLALCGDAEAAQKIVLPAFEPLLWLLSVSNLCYIVVYSVLLMNTNYLDHQNQLLIEIAVVVKQINGLLVPIYMLQPSLSLRALRDATLQTVLLSVYTIPVVVVLNYIENHDNARICYWTLMGARALAGAYLLALIWNPPARSSVRIFRITCAYVITMMLLIFATAESFHRGHPKVAKRLAWVITVYSMVLPLCVWHLLRADTEHWRGIGKRAVELQDVFRRKNGKIDERVSSQGLHVLIEMHRKFIIDFAHLQLREPIRQSDRDRNLAAAVYRGFLHTKKIPVAVKIYMPAEFTEEIVAEFSHEAALCGALVHPNILKFHGLCVCPPNICLVSELCQASLQDITDAQAEARRRHALMPPQRQQFLINIGYMVDAARAVAYLHSFSPAFVHRDIKPSNFLIDDEGTVKLTDFGASRTLTLRSTSSHQYQTSHVANNSDDAEDHGSFYGPPVGRTVLEMPGIVAGAAKCTAQYMAPEVIKGCHAGTAIYGEAADVYSLAMTTWDILHPGMAKYHLGSTGKSTVSTSRRDYGPGRDSEIFELVLSGERPMLDPNMHASLKELLQAAWHADPRHRPTAQAMIVTLTSIQEEACAVFAYELAADLQESGRQGGLAAKAKSSAASSASYAGTRIVEKLRISDIIDSQSEAIRLGNMLMDSGFLHHAKHCRSFEYAGSQYYFDDDQITLCQPLAMMDLEADNRSSCVVSQRLKLQTVRDDLPSTGSEDQVYTNHRDPSLRAGSRSSRVVMERRCACRQLGRRLENGRASRSRFQRKFKVFSDENLLTAQLLEDDQTLHGADFAAFREPTQRPAGKFGVAASEAA